MMQSNMTIVKLAFQCDDAHWRNEIDRALVRNNDRMRRKVQSAKGEPPVATTVIDIDADSEDVGKDGGLRGCKICGAPLTGRSDRKTCGEGCRQELSRILKSTKKSLPFSSPDAEEATGLDMDCDDQSVCSTAAPSSNSTRLSIGGSSTASTVAASFSSSQKAMEPQLTLFVDELVSPAVHNGGQEVFLRDLPCEDMSEEELQKWLSDFGQVEDAVFLRTGHAGEAAESGTNANQLTGCAYCRFSSLEGATAILAAFPADEAGNVQCSRSISEHLQQQLERPEKGSLGALLRRLPELRTETGCPSLVVIGTGASGEGDGISTTQGPLRFSWLRTDLGLATEHFREVLAKAVSAALEGIVLATPVCGLVGSSRLRNNYPLPLGIDSWDFPLSREEQKALVLMIDHQELQSKIEELQSFMKQCWQEKQLVDLELEAELERFETERERLSKELNRVKAQLQREVDLRAQLQAERGELQNALDQAKSKNSALKRACEARDRTIFGLKERLKYQRTGEATQSINE
jgi:hypothetical protein